MWELVQRPLSATVTGASIRKNGQRASHADVISAWQDDTAFRAFWNGALAGLSHQTYCLETPPLTRGMLLRPFECVFVESPALKNLVADPEPFSEQFRQGLGAPVMSFESLGKDALLTAPLPLDGKTNYAHLAAFVRSAPAAQADELWRLVALGLNRRMSDTPLWLSTAGLGVHWLHVRIDTRPKYYRHRPYAQN